MLLQYSHIIFLPHDATYFVKCTSHSCSKAPSQHYAATPVLDGWDGILRLASLPLYPPNTTLVFMAIMAIYVETRGHFSKKFYLCHHVQLHTVVWLFYGGFGAVAFPLLSSLSGYVDIGLVLLWI